MSAVAAPQMASSAAEMANEWQWIADVLSGKRSADADATNAD
jgi:hypothetical protein